MRERSMVRSLDGVTRSSASVMFRYAASFCSKNFSAYRSFRARRRKNSTRIADSDPPKNPPTRALQWISMLRTLPHAFFARQP